MCKKYEYKVEKYQDENEQKTVKDIDDLIFDGEVIKLHSEK